jgi:CheY-like chemotaxis protein
VRILLVEDDHLQADLIRDVLIERWPHSRVDLISTESEFRRSLDSLRENQPDIAIIDVMLRWENPRLDLAPTPKEILASGCFRAGFRCAELLLAEPETEEVPVLLYSVLERGELGAEIADLPPNVHFLSKHSDEKRLIRLVGSLVATRRPVEVSGTKMRDVFICHASEDRETVVNPLVMALEASGITVWQDRAEIRWGDSIVRKIEEGLLVSRYVIAVLSVHSIGKPWPRRELASALSGEISDGVVKVLPLVVGDATQRREILGQMSLQQDKLYEVWSGSPEPVVGRLKERLT